MKREGGLAGGVLVRRNRGGLTAICEVVLREVVLVLEHSPREDNAYGDTAYNGDTTYNRKCEQ